MVHPPLLILVINCFPLSRGEKLRLSYTLASQWQTMSIFSPSKESSSVGVGDGRRNGQSGKYRLSFRAKCRRLPMSALALRCQPNVTVKRVEPLDGGPTQSVTVVWEASSIGFYWSQSSVPKNPTPAIFLKASSCLYRFFFSSSSSCYHPNHDTFRWWWATSSRGQVPGINERYQIRPKNNKQI